MFASLLFLIPISFALPSVHRRTASGIPYTSNAISLSRREVSSSGLTKRWYGSDVQLSGPRGGNILVGDIMIGTQTFTVRFDTGSSDIWVPGPNITCPNAKPGAVVNDSNLADTISTCKFAHPPYDPALNPNYAPLGFANNFNLTYATGVTAGVGAQDDISVGGITVPQQIFAIADQCDTVFGWGGTSDGVFGLAGRTLTSIHYGSDGANDTIDQDSLYLYDPWFEAAWTSGVVEPYVTFLLKPPTREQVRGTQNITDYGVMSLGGIPEGAPESEQTVTVPNLEFLNISPNGEYFNVSWWTAAVDAFKFPGSDKIPIENNSSPLCIFDSGQSGISIPPVASEAFHALIEPKATRDPTTGYYYAPCNATVPDLGVVIGGIEFTVPGQNILVGDLSILGPSIAPADYCFSLLGPSVSDDGRLYMGDTFFWSVMVTKDYRAKELIFTQSA